MNKHEAPFGEPHTDKNMRKRWKVKDISTQILAMVGALHDAEIYYQFGGGVRRGEEYVEAVTILVPRETKILHACAKLSQNWNFTATGWIKGHWLCSVGNVQFTFHFANKSNWGAKLLFATGSIAFLKQLTALANNQAMNLTENGLFDPGGLIAAKTEKSILSALGLPWIPPKNRRGGDIYETAESRPGSPSSGISSNL